MELVKASGFLPGESQLVKLHTLQLLNFITAPIQNAPQETPLAFLFAP
jgi:hypothetical protein